MLLTLLGMSLSGNGVTKKNYPRILKHIYNLFLTNLSNKSSPAFKLVSKIIKWEMK